MATAKTVKLLRRRFHGSGNGFGAGSYRSLMKLIQNAIYMKFTSVFNSESFQEFLQTLTPHRRLHLKALIRRVPAVDARLLLHRVLPKQMLDAVHFSTTLNHKFFHFHNLLLSLLSIFLFYFYQFVTFSRLSRTRNFFVFVFYNLLGL
jgi:hypothetical protein